MALWLEFKTSNQKHSPINKFNLWQSLIIPRQTQIPHKNVDNKSISLSKLGEKCLAGIKKQVTKVWQWPWLNPHLQPLLPPEIADQCQKLLKEDPLHTHTHTASTTMSKGGQRNHIQKSDNKLSLLWGQTENNLQSSWWWQDWTIFCAAAFLPQHHDMLLSLVEKTWHCVDSGWCL